MTTTVHQWIHTRSGPPPVRSVERSHGYLTPSLVITLFASLLEVEDVRTKFHYGLDKVGFPPPVPVDSRVRLVATIRSVASIGEGAVRISLDAVVEIDGGGQAGVWPSRVYRFYR